MSQPEASLSEACPRPSPEQLLALVTHHAHEAEREYLFAFERACITGTDLALHLYEEAKARLHRLKQLAATATDSVHLERGPRSLP